VTLLALALTTLSTVCIEAGVAGFDTPVAHAAASETTAFNTLAAPLRLLDTRSDGGPLGRGQIRSVSVTGIAPLPDPAVTRAVVLNVTVVGPAGVGFWTLFPRGTALPSTSNLYVDERASISGRGLAMSNLVTVLVGSDGMVDIFSQSGGDVVVDLFGSYQTSGAVAAGRFVPLASPSRITDTRSWFPLAPDSSFDVAVPGGAGASAAVLNVTTIASGAGFWTVSAGPSAPRPPTANLNSLSPFHIASNQVIAPLDASGTFTVYSQSGGHLIVDLVGFMTGPGAAVSTEGLFVPLTTATRVLDTREPALNPLGTARMALPTWNLEVGVTANPAIGRSDVAAVVVNLTTTESLAAGYVSLSPAGANDQTVKARGTATMNVARAGQTLPNHATVAVSGRGFDVFTQSGGHLIADVAGYYLGAPVAAPFGGPVNTDPTPVFCPGFPTAAIAPIVYGSSPATVARVQQRLIDLGFWNQGADGSYGWSTSQAVMAFQKWAGLSPSSSVDDATAAMLNRPLCRPAPGVPSGDLFEVDKGRQLGFIVRGGKTQWVVNISTGGNYAYQAIDQKTGGDASGIAITPVGSFKVYRFADEVAYKGSLGTLYRPRFFSGGIAIHGYRSVPNFPASHGCVRVSNPAMDMIWATNAMPQGSRVVVHE